MSYRFPEERKIKTRKCFKCGKTLEFGELFLRNKHMDKDRLIQLWENIHIEFYCCLCYNRIEKERNLKKKRINLSIQEKEAIHILEKKCGRPLEIIPIIKCNSVGFTIENGQITGLSLYMCDIMKIPKEIRYLSSLRKLNLSWNQISLLPDFISALSSLEVLDLIGNNLSYISPKIDKLKNLEILDLSFNNLKYVPSTIANLELLERLNLIHNKLKEIPKSFQKLEEKAVKILL
jgi:hypothetical protein